MRQKEGGAYTAVGRADMSVQLLLLDTVIKQTLLANTETWCDITPKEEAMITSKHHSVLCIIFGQRTSTPYWGNWDMALQICDQIQNAHVSPPHCALK